MLPNEPAPLPYEAVALPEPAPAPRVLPLRKAAAIALVGVLAAAWFGTTHLGPPDTSAAGRSAASGPERVPPPSLDAAFLRLLPEGAQCDDQAGSGAEAHCSVAGVDVTYRSLAPDRARAEYRAAVGPGTSGAARSRPPACARGAEEERSWSRPASPGVAAGRYACRVEQGRAAMWWTVGDRGLLVHAIASDGDLSSLFAWWESHSER